MQLTRWTFVVITVLSTVLMPVENCCVVVPGKSSFADQVINIARNFDNRSITILVHPGNYSATNGSYTNFVNFINVTLKLDSKDAGKATIMCPKIVSSIYSGIGFDNSSNITIVGLDFIGCGPTTAALYIFNSFYIEIINSSFHHNTNNGIQIYLGNYFVLRNCYFYSNVGLQPNLVSTLITTNSTGGVGFGAYFIDQSNVNLLVENCTFQDNIAYKTAEYISNSDGRPFGYIPFGNGGGIYLQVINVNNLFAKVHRCHFYDNIAIHQGGALAMISVNSDHNVLLVTECNFVHNRALGRLLRSSNDTVDNIDTFINKTKKRFSSFANSLDRSIENLPISSFGSAGGLGGAIAVSLYGTANFNELHVKNSNFSENWAIISGTVAFVVRNSLSDDVDSNAAFITSCRFVNNFALNAGSAIGVLSYTRVDFGTKPINIANCTFLNNSNMIQTGSTASNRHRYIGAISALRFPLKFTGTNVFHSNNGGGLNINHARIIINGRMEFIDNHGAALGGTIRLGELVLMHVLPDTELMFVNNTASQFGGAIAAENFRGGNDTALILNNFCFIQYDIGGEHEYKPDNWKMKFIFENNKLTTKGGEGEAFFADDISQCVKVQSVTDSQQFFNFSIFSVAKVFNFSKNQDEMLPYFESGPHTLFTDNETITISLGEIFNLFLFAKDQNNLFQDAVYSYHKNPTASPSDIIEVDLSSVKDITSSFAAVNSNGTLQRTALIMRNSNQLQNICSVNQKTYQNFLSSFVLHLIDSSNGQVVNTLTVDVNITCCHVGYEYNSTDGVCVFIYGGGNNVIIRQDSSNRYIFIQSDRYGGFDSDGYFVTARIPPSYQNCTQEGRLSGCLVKDDDLDQQCSQGRTGFLCGKCSSSSNQGTALNLIECVSCEKWHIVMFVLYCVLIVVVSLLVIYCNIGLPNALKGFLFFIQVTGYIYRTGARSGKIQWHYYLSGFFGFSLYFPWCISPNLDAVEVTMLGYISPVLITMCVVTYIMLARFIPRLSKKKTVDGIWFLVLIIYVYTADTCLNLLRCVQVYDPNKPTGMRVYYYDGTLQCFHQQHLPYGVIAVFISVVVLIPLTLSVLAISFNMIKKSGPIRDVISFGIKNDCHWWSGYDLLRRLLFFVVYLIFENFESNYTQFALTFTSLLILVITSRVRPYTNKWVNFIEVLILLDLVLLSAYFLDNRRLPSTVNNDFAVTLLIIPFIYFSLYLLTKIVGWCWKQHMATHHWRPTHSSLLNYWKVSSENDELVSNITPIANDEDSMMYSEYRDELRDLVAVED